MVLTPSSMSILPAYLLCMPGSRVMAMHSTATNQRPFCLVHENSYMPSQSVSIPDSRVPLSQNSTVLGVTLDSTLSLNKHTSPNCQSVYFHMSALTLVRSTLSEDTATALAVTLVQSRLDYANSILFKTSTSNIKKLQRAQNALARIALPNLRSTPSLLLASTGYRLSHTSHTN